MILPTLPAFGQAPEGGKIVLRKGLFSGVQFTHGSSEKHKIYAFAGLSLTPEFQRVIQGYPPALREIRRAYPYNGLAFAGYTSMLAISVKNFVDTINKASKVSGGQWVDDSFRISDVVPIFVAATVTVVGGVAGGSHLRKGIRMYNEGRIDFPATRHVAGGFRIGVNSARLAGVEESGVATEPRVGLSAGAFIRFPIGPVFGIQPEVQFSQKGYREGDATIELTYLDLPLLLRVTPFHSAWEPHLLIGPALGLKLEEALLQGGEKLETPESLIRSTDFGLTVGGGFRLGRSPFVADFRYARSLSSVYREPTGYSPGAADYGGRSSRFGPAGTPGVASGPDFRNSVISIGIEYSN